MGTMMRMMAHFLSENNRGQKQKHDIFEVTEQQQQQNANQKTIYHKK